jgi:tetratricopeptide (TPR) repeat protein
MDVSATLAERAETGATPWPLRAVTAVERFEKAVRALREAEAAADDHRPADALRLLEEIGDLVRTSPPLRVRALLVESWALMSSGDAGAADRLLEQAGWLAASPGFGELDRAEVLFRLGCCRLRQARVGNATALLTVALEDVQRSSARSVELQASILQWRARCWLRQNPPDRAGQDVELALELVEGGSSASSPTSTSRRRSWPSAVAAGCSPGCTPRRRWPRTRRSETVSPRTRC